MKDVEVLASLPSGVASDEEVIRIVWEVLRVVVVAQCCKTMPVRARLIQVAGGHQDVNDRLGARPGTLVEQICSIEALTAARQSTTPSH
jgi:hypothetical protein